MENDRYSDRINLYKDCIDILRAFNYVNEEIDKRQETRMGIRCTIEVLKELDAIETTPLCIKSNENTIRFKYNRYFENKVDELEAARSRDILSERSTRSAEESAHAAKESAKSAKEANVIANASNSKSNIANWVAATSALFTFLTLVYYILDHYHII